MTTVIPILNADLMLFLIMVVASLIPVVAINRCTTMPERIA